MTPIATRIGVSLGFALVALAPLSAMVSTVKRWPKRFRLGTSLMA